MLRSTGLTLCCNHLCKSLWKMIQDDDSMFKSPQRIGNIRPITIPWFQGMVPWFLGMVPWNQGMVHLKPYPEIRVWYPEIRVWYPEIRVWCPEIRVWYHTLKSGYGYGSYVTHSLRWWHIYQGSSTSVDVRSIIGQIRKLGFFEKKQIFFHRAPIGNLKPMIFLKNNTPHSHVVKSTPIWWSTTPQN